MLARALQCVSNIPKEVALILDENKPAARPLVGFLPAPSRDATEVTCELQPRARTLLNEHFCQLSRDATDYQHLDKHAHEDTAASEPGHARSRTSGSHGSKLGMLGYTATWQHGGKGQDASFYKFSSFLPGLNKQQEQVASIRAPVYALPL